MEHASVRRMTCCVAPCSSYIESNGPLEVSNSWNEGCGEGYPVGEISQG